MLPVLSAGRTLWVYVLCSAHFIAQFIKSNLNINSVQEQEQEKKKERKEGNAPALALSEAIINFD